MGTEEAWSKQADAKGLHQIIGFVEALNVRLINTCTYDYFKPCGSHPMNGVDNLFLDIL